jgi:hypothetical protein
VKIQYEYTVNGKKYVSNRIHFGKDMSYKTLEYADPEDIYQNIKNDKFPVYFFPSFPRLSVLQPGIVGIVEHIYAIAFLLAVPFFLWLLNIVVSKLMT